ncbi:MAG: hypothetical protein LBE83_06400, partial [Propionibacteriaceae bacterium]|nr:hypothetical protein [Propionibacteriaceae bacterium]
MTPPANRSHKRLGIATVIVIAVALATGGTWAWFDFSQRFSNTFHALSESDYQPILVNEFDYVARTKTDWEVEVPVVKPVYITYDHLDPLYEASGGHLEDNGAVSGVDCSTYYKPTYVRVMLTETLKIHDLDGGATAQYGPWIYKGTESTYVTWTMGPDIVPVATWKTAYTGGTGPMTGPFWIRDTDGWFYWAEPLAHGDRTTTILESIKLLHLATYEELEYTVHIQLEAIDHGLRDLQKWRDPLESKNPTMGIDIRPLFGLTNFGVDNQGNNITLPITTGTNGNGPYFSPAIALDGINLMAAGHNATGSLSDGSFVSRTTPVHMLWDPVTLMTQKNVRDVRQGHRTTYILKS